MSSPRTVLMFSGQGSHYFQMGRELFENNRVFRDWMMRLNERAEALLNQSVLDAIYSGGKTTNFDRTLLTHPAIFMIEYSLAQCLLESGVMPHLLLGTSLGSFAAAAVAGCIEVDDAMRAVVKQAIAFESCCTPGGMISVLADPALFAEDFLSRHSELAAINFDSHFTVAARDRDVSEIEIELRKRGVTHQRLAVSFAFHSKWIDEARGPFESFMRSMPYTPARLPLACCEQAALLSAIPRDFFWRVVRKPIRLRETVAMLERSGVHRYVDVGPAGTMATFTKYCLPAGSLSTTHAILTPYGRDVGNLSAALSAINGVRS